MEKTEPTLKLYSYSGESLVISPVSIVESKNCKYPSELHQNPDLHNFSNVESRIPSSKE
jgi:hypothetical protein